jgi:hypothetical protein
VCAQFVNKYVKKRIRDLFIHPTALLIISIPFVGAGLFQGKFCTKTNIRFSPLISLLFLFSDIKQNK